MSTLKLDSAGKILQAFAMPATLQTKIIAITIINTIVSSPAFLEAGMYRIASDSDILIAKSNSVSISDMPIYAKNAEYFALEYGDIISCMSTNIVPAKVHITLMP